MSHTQRPQRSTTACLGTRIQGTNNCRSWTLSTFSLFAPHSALHTCFRKSSVSGYPEHVAPLSVCTMGEQGDVSGLVSAAGGTAVVGSLVRFCGQC
jgi:hypothetical protein